MIKVLDALTAYVDPIVIHPDNVVIAPELVIIKAECCSLSNSTVIWGHLHWVIVTRNIHFSNALYFTNSVIYTVNRHLDDRD